MNLWIGTSGFQYPEWKGTFYPDDLPVAKMLSYYSERFAATEINYSFRRIPSPGTIAKWSSLTPERFRFSLKAPQKVTHFAKLRDCGDTMAYFHSVVTGLGAKLGPVLVQLPPGLKKDTSLLQSFLQALPKTMRVAVEFRHLSWFEEDVFDVLRAGNAALCFAESADLKTPRVVTANFGYLRLRRADYTEADIAEWADYLRNKNSEWSDAFVYFKHEEAGTGPRFAKSLIALTGLNG
jgi:uncharacterized protein YecE (DUF72 family)